jgi:hypothetical protein
VAPGALVVCKSCRTVSRSVVNGVIRCGAVQCASGVTERTALHGVCEISDLCHAIVAVLNCCCAEDASLVHRLAHRPYARCTEATTHVDSETARVRLAVLLSRTRDLPHDIVQAGQVLLTLPYHLFYTKVVMSGS